MNAPTLSPVDAVPTVEETPGLVAVWSLVQGAHVIYHAGRWRLLHEVQPCHLNPVPGTAPSVYLRLEGPTVERVARRIDPTSGVISEHPYRVHLGPVLVRPVDALVRARLREQAA